MSKKAWIHQDLKDLKRRGADKASWAVGYYDQHRKRRSRSTGLSGEKGRKAAEKLRKQIEAELITNTHDAGERTTWAHFQRQFTKLTVPIMRPNSQRFVVKLMKQFTQVCHPHHVGQVNTRMIDTFIAHLRQSPGQKPGSKMQPSTVNRDLDYLRGMLRRAVEWGYLPALPKFKKLREPEKKLRWITPEDFSIIYDFLREYPRCVNLPDKAGCLPGEWWRAFMIFSYFVGWRKMTTLALKWENVDLEKRVATALYYEQKGNRTADSPLAPIVVDHLRMIRGDDPRVLPWDHGEPTVGIYFHKIQRRAGIHLPCQEDHPIHTPRCYTYPIHSLRRAFITQSARRVDPSTVQRLAHHQHFTTTAKYIEVTKSRLHEAVDGLPVPEGVIPAGADSEG